MVIFTTLRGEIHNSISYKLQNSMEVDSVVIIVILNMSYFTTRIVKKYTSVAKIPRVPVENQFGGKSCHKILFVHGGCEPVASKKMTQGQVVPNFTGQVVSSKISRIFR